ncbi:hypothetical protein BX600DRAFT_112283 [Xylariales sp. PMI_506]|nr:hypothetical protein BX600DRAFT_112283 [Xylariales sp. PMI_506]
MVCVYNIWRYIYSNKHIKVVNKVQAVGAQAVIGAFTSIATVMAETEASIAPARDRWARKGTKIWVNYLFPNGPKRKAEAFRDIKFIGDSICSIPRIRQAGMA